MWKGVNILKCFTKNKWRAFLEICLMFYTYYIYSIMDYVCIFYVSAANSNLLILDRMQARSLKICLGAFRSFPLPAVLVKATVILTQRILVF